MKSEYRELIEKNKNFFDCVILRAATLVKKGAELNQDTILKAVQEEMSFSEEMALQLTDRSKLAAKAICNQVWKDLNKNEVVS